MNYSISFILTTRNVLPYTKLAYESIRKYNPHTEIVLLDDDSRDGTIEWIKSLNDPHLIKWFNTSGKQLGHTKTYNIGVDRATSEVILIFHSDMVCTPNFVSNIIKHIKPKTIVSGTRIEPPVYPSDDAKILKDFGVYIEQFKQKELLKFVQENESLFKNQITKGFFAPWAMLKNEYIKIGGMDKLFAPYPTEDSDFINRLYLDKYDIIQSRDSFCYHWASRSHRWTTGRVNVDTQEFKRFQKNSIDNFLRKWGCFPENNSLSYPIVHKKYDIGFEIVLDEQLENHLAENILAATEPLCSTIYTDVDNKIINNYIKNHQLNTLFDLKRKFKNLNDDKTNDIIISFSSSNFLPTQTEDERMTSIQQLEPSMEKSIKTFMDKTKILNLLPKMITDSGVVGIMEYDIFKLEIKSLNSYEKHFIHVDDPYYQNLLKQDN